MTLPDSVSSEYLKSLLTSANALPASSALPKINFGAEIGGLGELTLVNALLINQAAVQPNAAQVALMVFTMISQLKQGFEEELARLDIDEISSTERAFAERVVRNLSTAQDVLAPVTERLVELAAAIRFHALASDVLTLDPRQRDSRLLISDECLSDLQISREQITDLLNGIFPFRIG